MEKLENLMNSHVFITQLQYLQLMATLKTSVFLPTPLPFEFWQANLGT